MSEKPPDRPTKYDPDRHIEIASDLGFLGATNEMIAAALEIQTSTFYEWMKKYPELSEAVNASKIRADGKVARSMYEAACGFEHEAIHFSAYEGMVTETPYIKKYPPDTRAALNWLKNRQPEIWREKPEPTGDEVEPVTSITYVEEDASKAE